MIAIGEYREKARSWLASVADEFSRAARKGLSQDEDLALGRRYMAARYDAGFGGINLPVEFGGQGMPVLLGTAVGLVSIRMATCTRRLKLTRK